MLTSDEEPLIETGLMFAAKRGFGIGKDSLKSMVTQAVPGRRPIWNVGGLSDDAILSCTSRDRELISGKRRTNMGKQPVKLANTTPRKKSNRHPELPRSTLPSVKYWGSAVKQGSGKIT